MARGCPAIILAAGQSSRLGQPKALVEVGGLSLVALSHQRLQKAGCSPIIIVTRSELSVDIMLQCPGAKIVVNQYPEEGRTGSIQCGIMALSGENGKSPKQVLIAPVDRIGWSSETVKELLAHKGSIKPVKGELTGHPIVIGGHDVEAVLAGYPDEPLRDIVGFEEIRVSYLKRANIDTPADLEILLANKDEFLNL